MTIVIAIIAFSLFGKVLLSPRYKYQIYFFNDLLVEEQMNRYGSKSWKMISCRRASSSKTDTYGYEYIMSKAK